MAKHGVFVTQAASVAAMPATRTSGIPFVFGSAPIQSAAHPAPVNMPVLVRSFSEFRDKFGYSDDWNTYNICEMAYSHFAVYGCAPLIVVCALDPANMNESVAAADINVVAHRAELPLEAIDNANLVIKQQGGSGSAYVKGTDYALAYDYDAGKLYVSVLPDGAAYAATKLNIAYKKVKPSLVTTQALKTALDAIEYCATSIGLVPDMIVCPYYSSTATIGKAMAEKAKRVNGLFRCVALIDIESNTVTTVAGAIARKASDGIAEPKAFGCWPKVQYGDRIFCRSTALAGVTALTDSENGGYPNASASNRPIKCDANVLDDGTEIYMTNDDAEALNDAGIITGLNFLGGFKMWGSHTEAYPDSDKPEEIFTSVVRMMNYLNNEIVRMLWDYIDQPLTTRVLDNIMNKLNVWLNGLVGIGALTSAKAALADPASAEDDLRNGIINIALCAVPPTPLQEINVVLSYGTDFLNQL